MRIFESTIQLASYHAAEEADVVQEEKTRQIGRRGTRLRQSRGWGLDRDSLPSVWVDRVSISNQTRQKVQSEYSAGIETAARVTSETGETVFGNKELVERMVGETIDREVTVRTLRDGDDIRPGNGISSGFESTSVQRNSVERLVSVERTGIHFEEEQMAFSSQGRVLTQDGREIEFSLDMNMDRAFLSKIEEQTLIHTWQEKVNLVDPLVISLDGSISELTDTRFEFDLDNDGRTEEISFVSKGSGFLSFDRNNDGKINNGSELFGPGTGNGFGELGEFDLNKNGWIDEDDAVFSQLSVWTRDDQGNDVLVSLKDAGVGAVYLDNAQSEFTMTTMDNELKGQVKRSGLFLFENGNVGSVQQIDLAARAIEEERGSLSRAGEPVEVLSLSGVTDGAVKNGKTENPLQALIDQIQALREEIQQILGAGKKEYSRFRGTRTRAMSFSDAQLYRMTHPNAANFETGRFWQG